MIPNDTCDTSITRRAFLATSASALILPSLGMSKPNNIAGPFTVQQVIDIIIKSAPVPPLKETVDTLKTGKPDTVVTGIITTMFATTAIVRRAIDQKANFIIAHEPTAYNHLDETAWLENDKVWKFKRDLLEQHNIAVWRLHDCWHAMKPDGVLMGIFIAMGWMNYYNPNKPQIINIPATSLKDLVQLIKTRLSITNLRIVGDPSQECKKIALLPGAAGSRRQIQLIQNENPDVLLCGESPEWETVEYIRDANEMGAKQSLVVMGHCVSEEPGMSWLATWLQPKVPGIQVVAFPSQDPFRWM
jgi:putative NIF3 family GTP cyclohydrolase 1 type 2